MDALQIVMIAVGLAMDAAAVSLSAAASGYANEPRAVFRLSFHFGLFQFMMPVLGWLLGIGMERYVSSVDHWIAFGLLGYVGARMIGSGLKPSDQDLKADPSRGLTLVMLSVATSIDALAIGLSLAMLKVSIWYPSMTIGIITAVLSVTAIKFGNKLGAAFGQRIEIVGGIILVAIGLRIVLSHTLG